MGEIWSLDRERARRDLAAILVDIGEVRHQVGVLSAALPTGTAITSRIGELSDLAERLAGIAQRLAGTLA